MRVEGAVPGPAAEIAGHSAARRHVLWQRRPLATGAQNVHQPIDDFAHHHRRLVATRLGDDNSFTDTLRVDGGLTLESSTLDIVSDENESSRLDFHGAQSARGTGTIDLISSGDAGSTSNTIRFLGQTDLDEVLTFEAGISGASFDGIDIAGSAFLAGTNRSFARATIDIA